MTDAFVVLPGQGEMLDLGNFRAEVLAAGERTGGELTVLRTQEEPPGFGPPLHRHRDAAEAFYVLAGEYLMYAEDEQWRCPPGSFVHVPRGVPHTFKVVSEEPGTKLNLFTPAAMERFFRDLAQAETDGTASHELLERIAEHAEMEVLGPVPDTYL